MARKPRARKENGQENALTSIPPRIHCPATTDWVGGRDEIDEIAINNFLDALAQVALAVATRKLGKDHRSGEVDS
jgi:hypothetical protein